MSDKDNDKLTVGSLLAALRKLPRTMPVKFMRTRQDCHHAIDLGSVKELAFKGVTTSGSLILLEEEAHESA